MVTLGFVGNKKELLDFLKSKVERCSHVCTGRCEYKGCGCRCGEWHCIECAGTGIVERDGVEVKCECQD